MQRERRGVAAVGPTRVMHVSQPDDGGTATVVERLAASDLMRGWVVTVVSPPGRLQRWAESRGAAWVPLPLSRAPGPGDVVALGRLRHLLPAADVVCLHSSKAGAVGRLALASLPARDRPACVFMPHAWSWYVGGRLRPVYRLFERVAARWSDVIVVVSPAEERDGRTLLGPSSRTMRLIENGVDVDAFSPSGPVAHRTPEPLVVCVGRLCPQKGQDLLIRALALLGDDATRLVLVGDGPDRNALGQLARQLGVADRVHLAGRQDPGPYYRAADVVAVPSRWEGLSLVLLEALSCGAAVLATAAATAEFRGRSAVVTTPSGQPADLAAGLTALLDDPHLRADIGRQGRSLMTGYYSLDRAVTEYASVVDSVIRGRPRPMIRVPA
jgi:glycosyltransferase involved in cell wall biosynthesis